MRDCVHKINKAAKKGSKVVFCSFRLNTENARKLVEQGYEVKYIRDDVDWQFSDTSALRVSWENAAAKVNKE